MKDGAPEPPNTAQPCLHNLGSHLNPWKMTFRVQIMRFPFLESPASAITQGLPRVCGSRSLCRTSSPPNPANTGTRGSYTSAAQVVLAQTRTNTFQASPKHHGKQK